MTSPSNHHTFVRIFYHSNTVQIWSECTDAIGSSEEPPRVALLTGHGIKLPVNTHAYAVVLSIAQFALFAVGELTQRLIQEGFSMCRQASHAMLLVGSTHS